MTDKSQDLIDEFSAYLSPYKPCIFDGGCGEPIIWGHEIIRHIPESDYARLAASLPIEVIQGQHITYIVALRYLTHEEAEQQYGAMTHLDLGARGGFRSVTYGNKKFISKRMAKIIKE